MPSQEDIEPQQRLLRAHRKTLAILLRQQAKHTDAYTPPATVHGINEARVAIRRIKENLRGWSVDVKDHPDDEDNDSDVSLPPFLPTPPTDFNLPPSDKIPLIKEYIQHNEFSEAVRLLEETRALNTKKDDFVSLGVQVVENPEVPLKLRIRAAEIIGEIGDPRIPVSLSDWEREYEKIEKVFGESLGYWCFIQFSAFYWIGGPLNDSFGIALSEFWIARYPVTNAQYEQFILDGGYTDKGNKYWTANGMAWKQREGRAAPLISRKAANRPVTNVTWYEAAAYTNWLNEKIGDFLPAKYRVRLPTEAEWEAAAFFDASIKWHKYPWGELAPSPELAIYEKCGLARPAPVGCCPKGQAACGALDIVGNVFEILTNRFRQSISERFFVESDFSEDQHHSVPWHGGSYNGGVHWLRSSLSERLYKGAADCDDETGFRLVLVYSGKKD